MRAASILLLCCFLYRSGRADEVAAREHFKKGQIGFETGDFDRAIGEFKQSYEESPKAQTLFALGQAYRGKGELALALRQYQLYLAKAPNGSYKDKVEQAIDEVQREIAENRATAPPHGVPPPPEPEPTTRNESTSTPSLGSPTTTAKSAPRVPAASAPAAPLASPSAPPVDLRRPWYRNGLGWGLAGSGVALVAIGGGLVGESAVLESDAARAQSQLLHDADISSAGPYKWSGVALVSVGSALVVGGVVVFALNNRSRK